MIASLTGNIAALDHGFLVIEVHGVGYLVHATPRFLAGLSLGKSITLHTTMVVREDAMTLYGFDSIEARNFFELLQSVTGIGPKVALSALSLYDPDDLATAIEREDNAAIERVPGLGKKGAQRLLLELKDKVAHLSLSSGAKTSQSTVATLWQEQLLSALVGLGFLAKDAQARIESVKSQVSDPANTEISELLRLALISGKQP
jgi:Holliday junction DNA helicase RuvA